ncbi:hypothetical protein [Microbacterium sp. CIAB417]|uniref:hypothetical protein n=1 Tax=Microbacterium sp. CIAB417 TaxID=2860287 RepID=UPI001FABF372|nr:hypothetical protein [Microbacterium sp. CIAB417]
MHERPSDGGHDFPPLLAGSSDGPEPPRARRGRQRRRRRRRVIGGVLIGLVLVGAGAGVQVAAHLGYDVALVAFQDAATVVENDQTDLATDAEQLRMEADAAGDIAAADSGTLMPAEARGSLDAAIAAATPALEDADAAATAAIPTVDSKPMWAWDLFAEKGLLEEETAALEGRQDDIAEQRDALSETGATVEESAVAAVQAAAAAAADLEAAHVNARNPEIVALRASAADVTVAVTTLDADAVSRYAQLESAAAALLESEQAELAEKAGPLHDARVEIEAFARSLAPDVLLDFDWSPTVPGYDGPSNGGWTTWWYGDPGYATIALSDYIAESWPASWAKALVAHEVGHAISVKCEAMYDSSNQDTIEEWATAWAIGMGFTDPANGTDVYGAPSSAMIDAAAACR